MKTKLSFFCTHAQYGTFEKVVFETVLDKTFEDLYDAKEWLDLEIPTIFDDFGFDLVFEWIILGYKETDEDIKPVEIKDRITGKLTFEKKEKKVKEKIYKVEIPTSEPEVKPEPKKEYDSVWIDPFGKTYKIGFAMHNEFAAKWLEENDKDSYKKATTGRQYYYEVLQDKGWVRILGWTTMPTFVLPDTIRPKLKTAIREYCLTSGIPYLYFPDILKS